MANSSINLTSLDFDTLKQSLKSYMQTQTVFKDYNFDGANMSVMLDLLAHNSYLNAFYLNMVASEMFLDSAQKLDSVVSHAKELNYVPRSARSSRATIDLTIETVGINPPLTLPKGTTFTGSNANGTFNFSTNQLFSFSSANSTYTISGLNIYDGLYLTDSFIMDRTSETQRFVMSNPTIDLSSLQVTVFENNSAVTTVFTRADTLFNLDADSNVYFVQAAESGKYELIFGDGLFGRVPLNEAVIQAEYRVCSSGGSDGVDNFIINADLGDLNGGEATVTSITVSQAAAGGAAAEEIEDIRFSAPRYFAAQQRAVASDDYASLVLANFGGEISDVSVYGGEQLEPKQYGRVVLSLKPAGGTITADVVKEQVTSYLSNYIAIPNRVIIADPDYLYCEVVTDVQYDKTSTKKFPVEIQGIITQTILSFSSANLEKFGSDFRYSRFVAAIDNADPSVASNDTIIRLAKRLTPKLNFSTSFDVDYGNEISALDSSLFAYISADNTITTNCRIKDLNGKLIVYTYVNNQYTVVATDIGSVDLAGGKVRIDAIKSSDYGNHLTLYAVPVDKDVIINRDKILIIDVQDVTVNVTDVQR